MRLAPLLAALLLAGCLSPTPPPTPVAHASGAYGTAMQGPTCPVERNPPDPNCADKPYRGNLSITDANGTSEIQRFATQADGSFNVSLSPGDYAIRSPSDAAMLPRCASEAPFTVREYAWVLVNVSCDTGIR